MSKEWCRDNMIEMLEYAAEGLNNRNIKTYLNGEITIDEFEIIDSRIVSLIKLAEKLRKEL